MSEPANESAAPRTTIEVRKPGLSTTIQDGGRSGYYHLGIPPSGALDQYSLTAANASRDASLVPGCRSSSDQNGWRSPVVASSSTIGASARS